MQQDGNNSATFCMVCDPCPYNTDKDADQQEEDKIHRIERAHFTWDKKARQMPDCPHRAEDDSGEPGTESSLQMRDCESCPTDFLTDGIHEIGSKQRRQVEREDQSPFFG